MPKNYAIALSHLALAGTGIYCLARDYSRGTLLRLPVGTFSLIAANSIIGCYKWGFRDGDNASNIYDFTNLLKIIFAMSCFAGQMGINGGYQREFGYLHPGLSLIPLAIYLSNKRQDNLIDLLVAENVISCGITSYLAGNNYGIAVTVIYGVNHFMICGQENYCDIPNEVVCNLIFCVSTFLIDIALGGQPIF